MISQKIHFPPSCVLCTQARAHTHRPSDHYALCGRENVRFPMVELTFAGHAAPHFYGTRCELHTKWYRWQCATMCPNRSRLCRHVLRGHWKIDLRAITTDTHTIRRNIFGCSGCCRCCWLIFFGQLCGECVHMPAHKWLTQEAENGNEPKATHYLIASHSNKFRLRQFSFCAAECSALAHFSVAMVTCMCVCVCPFSACWSCAHSLRSGASPNVTWNI